MLPQAGPLVIKMSICPNYNRIVNPLGCTHLLAVHDIFQGENAMNLKNSAEIQVLEPRALLSAAVLSDNTLHITGDNGVTNQISVSLSADGLTVNVSLATNGGAATTQTFAAADVDRVQIT